MHQGCCKDCCATVIFIQVLLFSFRVPKIPKLTNLRAQMFNYCTPVWSKIILEDYIVTVLCRLCDQELDTLILAFTSESL